MGWYDWVLFAGVLYMFIGTDFTLNWFGGLAYGKRLSHSSNSVIRRFYYKFWAHYDPNARAEHPDGPRELLAPWVTAFSVLNGTVICLIEVLLIVGFFMPKAAFVKPAAFAFIARAVIEFSYGSQLIFGPGRLKGWALLSYLIIALIPQIYIPSLVAMRFSGLDIDILSVFLFIFLPLILFLWVAIVYRRKAKDMQS